MKAIDVYNAIVTWSTAHTVAATAIGAFVAGFIVGKL